MKIASNKKIWYIFSSILVGGSLIVLSLWGLNFGIDFTGGTLQSLQFNEVNLSNEEITQIFQNLKTIENKDNNQNKESGIAEVIIQRLGEKEVLLKYKSIGDEMHREILNKLEEKAKQHQNNLLIEESKDIENQSQSLVKEVKFETIGPTIGKELRQKSFLAITIVLITLALYVAYAFRAVASEFNKYESLKYGVATIIALIHDILVVLGIFSILGHFKNVEINTSFIAAILTILGYSVNDTIIVFDRIRENILNQGQGNLKKTIDKSVNEVMVRSVNTSLVTILVLICILIFGGASTYYLVLALIIGIGIGTYSSIFLASPLLIDLDILFKNKLK